MGENTPLPEELRATLASLCEPVHRFRIKRVSLFASSSAATASAKVTVGSCRVEFQESPHTVTTCVCSH
jgi:hypothetical protein